LPGFAGGFFTSLVDSGDLCSQGTENINKISMKYSLFAFFPGYTRKDGLSKGGKTTAR
jgi:hypothetical protein